MASFSQLIIMGNLTRDPELRMTPKGTAIANLSIAYNTGHGDQERTAFVDCTAFGKIAEMIAKRYQKGANVFLTGELVMDTWEDKQTNERRSKLKMNIRDARLLGSKQEAGGADEGDDDHRAPRPAFAGGGGRAPSSRPDKDLEEDVPF